MPCGLLHSELLSLNERSELVRKKLRFDIDTLPGDDVHKPQLDTDISDTREFSIPLLKLLIYSNTVCNPI